MTQQILVPDIGDYTGVEIIEITAKVGSVLNKEDTIITVETDKAAMDIPAPYGLTIIELHVNKGDKISKGSLIATVEPLVINNKPVINPPSINNSTINIPNVTQNNINPKINQTNNLIPASPSTRKFARELGVNLDIAANNIPGSGHNGRIMENDLKKYINNILNNNSVEPDPDFSKYGNTETKTLARIQKKSGQNLHRNWVSIPHVTHFEEADITDLENYRHQQQKLAQQQNIKLTILTFFIKAVTKGLKNFPLFNSSLSSNGEDLIIKKYYNIGIAVDTDKGLVVPVVKNTDQKTLLQIAAELTNLSQKARDGKLTANEMQGGCFTISSLGGIGGVGFTPIINAPEVAILGISKSKIKPVYVNNNTNLNNTLEIQPRLILPLALSYDHRVIDGAAAAKFSKFIAEQLNNLEFIKDI